MNFYWKIRFNKRFYVQTKNFHMLSKAKHQYPTSNNPYNLTNKTNRLFLNTHFAISRKVIFYHKNHVDLIAK